MSSSVLDGPPPELRFRRRIRLGPSLAALWRMRPLIRSLAERDLRARYKQAVLGFAWAVVPPVALVIAFTLVFDRVGDVETHGAPYVLFSYLGLLAWNFFSTSVSTGANSLVANVPLLNKVSCPREVFPLAGIAVASVDWAVSVLALVALFPIAGHAPRLESLWFPVYLVVQVAFTVGVVLLLSIVVVYLRDLRHALSVLLQLGLFVTPVVYGLDVVPEEWRLPFVAVNPLAGVIDGYRRTVLFGQGPDWAVLGVSAASATVVLVVCYALFKRLETGIADVA